MKSAQIERRRQVECGERGGGASGAVKKMMVSPLRFHTWAGAATAVASAQLPVEAIGHKVRVHVRLRLGAVRPTASGDHSLRMVGAKAVDIETEVICSDVIVGAVTRGLSRADVDRNKVRAVPVGAAAAGHLSVPAGAAESGSSSLGRGLRMGRDCCRRCCCTCRLVSTGFRTIDPYP